MPTRWLRNTSNSSPHQKATATLPNDIKWLEVCRQNAEIFRTCSRRAYFAIILDEKGMVAGTGWNGVPSKQKHCIDGGCPRAAQEVQHGSTYDNCHAIHAEANAIIHSDWTARAGGDGATLYVNGPPCFSCAKLIANSGIKKVVCSQDEKYEEWPNIKKFLMKCKIRVFVL